ncbi:MAG TPA: DUF5996 family protein [Beijerinckiaceae bacterium]|jgi:hypothetical protein
MKDAIGNPAWPDIPYPAWAPTCQALHLFTQVIGKYRLARTPWVNHSWHATLYVGARGLVTGPIPDGPNGVEIAFDLVDHRLIGHGGDGRTESFALEPMSVAEFHRRFIALVTRLGGDARFHGVPSEIADAVPFEQDVAPRPYDRDAVARFFRALVSITATFQTFRTSFLGKVSPVHLFWGSFDLAVTRFSGRRAPIHPGGVPGLPDDVTREAYSHEVSSAGFWPGGGLVDHPAFYSYAYPAPAGFAAAQVAPEGAYFHEQLGEFVLPYDVVRNAPDPAAALLAFLRSTYRAAADLGAWDVAQLECREGAPGVVRPLG